MKNITFIIFVIIIYFCPWSVNAMMHEKLINNVAKELSKGLNQQGNQNSKLAVCPGSPTSDERQTRNWINCKGTFIASNGNKIFGKWERGHLQGKVFVTTPKGIVVEGTFKDSKLIGKFKQVKKPRSKNKLSKSDKVPKRIISKKKNNKSDKVFDRESERKIIENNLSSGLKVKNICQVVPVWRIRKSSAYYKGYFFLPILPKSYFYIGGYGTQNDKKGRHCVKVVKPVGVKSSIDLLAPPKDWEMIWNSEGTQARKTGSFWNAIPPNDSYTCVGSVAQNGLEKPNIPNYRCVHSSLVKEVKIEDILWSEEGANTEDQVSVFGLPESNTFVAVEGRYNEIEAFDIKTNLLVKLDASIVQAKLTQRETKWKKEKAEKKRALEQNRKRQQAARIAEAKRKRQEAAAKAEQAKKRAAAKAEQAKKRAAAKAEQAEQAKKRAAAKAASKRNSIFKGEDFKKSLAELFEGHKNDIVYLLNTKAKGITRGLSGNYILTSKAAISCFIEPTNYNSRSNSFQRIEEEKIIHKLKINSLNVRKCKPLLHEKSHVLIFSKVTKNTMSLGQIQWVLDRYKSSEYVKVYVADYGAYESKIITEKKAAEEQKLAKLKTKEKKQRQAEAKRKKIRDGVMAGSMKGYGVLKLKKKIADICIEDDEYKDAVELIAKDRLFSISQVSNLEGVFLNLKSEKCGSFIGKSSSMKMIAGAFDRDKIGFMFQTNWWTKRELAERRAKEVKEKPIREKLEREKAARELERQMRVKAEREKAARERAARARAAKIKQQQQRKRQLATEGFVATLTCGMGRHMNISACFAGRVGTEIKLTRNGNTKIYKVYQFRQLGREDTRGLHIKLSRKFKIFAQNSHKTLVLGLTIRGELSGKVYYQNEVAYFGVLRAKN